MSRVPRIPGQPPRAPRRRGGAGNGFANPNHPKRIAARERHIEWLRRRRRGERVGAIADEFGVSPSTVSEAIKNLLAECGREDAEALREIENQRMDAAHTIAADIAEQADADPELRLKALDRVVRVSKRRGEINGSDKPAQAPVGPDGKPVATAITIVYEGGQPDDEAAP